MSSLPYSAHDAIRLGQLMGALGVSPDSAVVLNHPGQPIPKARARTGKGRWYTPQATEAAEDALAWRLRAQRLHFPANVAVVAIFYRQDNLKVDHDNLMKLVLDAGTKAGVWRDDCQVTAGCAIVELDRDRPRTAIAFAAHDSSLKRHLRAV